GHPRLTDTLARAGRAAAGPELVQFDEVPRRVREEQPARVRPEPPVHDAVRDREPIELGLGLVDRDHGAGEVRRREIELAGGERGLRCAGNQVNLGVGACIDALAFAWPVPGHVVALEAEDIVVKAKGGSGGVRARRNPDRAMVQFRDLERHVPGGGSKISTVRSTLRSSPGARPPTPTILRASSAPPASRITTTTWYSPGPDAAAR